MSNYTKTTDFDVKDSLPSGDTGKIIRGSEFEVEFENIEVAIASKADSLNTVLTGTTTATNLSVTGNTTLGNAASDTVTVNADFSSDLLPSADATYDLGAPGSEWQDLYVTGTANVDSLVADTVAISGGTITATSLTVENNTTTDGLIVATAQGNVTVPATGSSLDFARAGSSYIRATDDAGNLRFITGANDFTSTRLFLANNGDVSFFEDTGVTAKLFWDASAESLDVANAVYSQFFAGIADRNTYWAIDGTDKIRAVTGGTQRMVIDDSGNVGININLPSKELDVKLSSPTSTTLGSKGGLNFTSVSSTTGNGGEITWESNPGEIWAAISGHITNNTASGSAGDLVFATADDLASYTLEERMRITNEGRVGIGTDVPSTFLEVSGTTTSGGEDIVHWSNSAGVNKGMLQLSTTGGGKITLRDAGNTEDVVIDSTGNSYFNGGNVGIGNSNPTSKLTVEDEAAILSTSSGGSSTLIVGSGQNSQDSVQGIQFKDRFGTSGFPNGQIGAYVQMERQGTNARYDLTFGTISSSTEDAAERMRITDTGNVGIGTSSPATNLHVSDATEAQIYLSDTGGAGATSANSQLVFTHGAGNTNNAYIGNDQNVVTGAFSMGTLVNYPMSFVINSSEVMRIETGGNVGIGTSSPSNLLHVAGASAGTLELARFRLEGATNNPMLKIEADEANQTAGIDVSGSTPAELTFSEGGVERMRIDASGRVGIGTTAPNDLLEARQDQNGETEIAVNNFDTGANASANLLLQSDGNNFRIKNFGDGTANPNLTEFISTAGGSAFSFSPSNSEKMRIDSVGNVGIGTTSPTEKLHVNGDALIGNAGPDANLYLFKRFDGTGALKFQRNTAGLPIDASVSCDANENLVFDWNLDGLNAACLFKSNSDEKMRIDSNGNLLVGTSSVNGNGGLSVAPSASVGSAQISFNRASNASSSSAIVFKSAGSTVGQILYSDTATAYNTSSDVRLKENITDAPEGNVDALQVRSFDWKVNGSHQEYGFIAQELEAVAPYAVTKGETEEDMWAVDYSKLVPMLVKEVQQLKAELAALKGTN